MSTDPSKKPDPDPEENIAVSVKMLRAFEGEINKMFEKWDSRLTDIERRNDELITARFNDLVLKLEEHAQVINAHSEGIRKLSERQAQSGGTRSDFFQEFMEVIKPVVQQRLTGANVDPATQQLYTLQELRLRGISREVLNHDKLEVRKMLKKGSLDVDEVVQAGVEGIIDAPTVHQHDRI